VTKLELLLNIFHLVEADKIFYLQKLENKTELFLGKKDKIFCKRDSYEQEEVCQQFLFSCMSKHTHEFAELMLLVHKRVQSYNKDVCTAKDKEQ
jgi:hypothetical protein